MPRICLSSMSRCRGSRASALRAVEQLRQLAPPVPNELLALARHADDQRLAVAGIGSRLAADLADWLLAVAHAAVIGTKGRASAVPPSASRPLGLHRLPGDVARGCSPPAGLIREGAPAGWDCVLRDPGCYSGGSYRRNSRSVSFTSLCGPGVAVSWPPLTLRYLRVPPTTVSRVWFVERWVPTALSWPLCRRRVAVS